MSRSYLKTPIVKDNKRGRKKAKRQANKKVRNEIRLHSGNSYKKVFNTWNIYDYVSYWSQEDATNFYNKLDSTTYLKLFAQYFCKNSSKVGHSFFI